MRIPLAGSRARALIACIALTLNLVGSGVPLLHAAAHSAHAESDAHERSSQAHHDAPPVEQATLDHEADHSASLHGECLYLNRLATAFALPAVPPLLPASVVQPDLAPSTPPVTEYRSRAPPPGDPARAPPLV